VTGWDSLGWLALLNAVEARYGITLSLDEAAATKTIGDLRRLIEAKVPGRLPAR
jgi:acyl carrier protein